ncbi:MAG TPA: VIT domain-containing protein [Gemmataceae bacterium]|nr:VIT domain-containing protein [Gemmataceae bacterium]
MRYALPAVVVGLWMAASVQGHGLLIPEDKNLPPLAMVNHRVQITIEDQVATTKVEQVFRNHTDRQLEATYIFPIPKGASVNKFSMTVDGKEQSGELVKADDARKVYTDIVRRTQDPGLLEYIGNNMMRLRIFPVEPKKDSKVILSFQAVVPADDGIVEYIYPLKTDGKATRTLEEFSIKATIRSQHAVQNVYSPTHAISLKKISDKQTEVTFERDQALLDKDFQLMYSTGNKEIGLTTMFYRPISSEDGYFLMLISPQIELSKSNEIPRDVVLVLDTSGSMSGVKMDQARKALKYCLQNLNPQDRFGLMNFSTTVTRYRDNLVDANSEQIDHAKQWVDKLQARGGTAIQDALNAAIDMRTKDENRNFTIVFFTDGEPTIGETNPDKIVKEVSARNSANTRIFTFGVGDDVNATFLDQLADQTRAVSTYVRPAEDIEAKVSSLYSKISHPVLANLRLTVGENVRLEEMYPPNLPDLFYGGQVIVLGRYSGQGSAAIKLSGLMGKETRDFVYETTFAPKTNEDREFVEQIWARRKVGYLLDQIRANGQKKELMDELLALAKKYSIATPFTSHLIVPDARMPVASAGQPSTFRGIPGMAMPGGAPNMGINGAGGAARAGTPLGIQGGVGGFAGGAGMPEGLAPKAPNAPPTKTLDFAKANQNKPGEAGEKRGGYLDKRLDEELEAAKKDPKAAEGKDGAARLKALEDAKQQKSAYDQARQMLASRQYKETQSGKLGVDLSLAANQLRAQDRLAPTAQRQCNGRNCVELGGVWIDDGFDPAMKPVVVKAQSDAYFRILEKFPKMKDVYRLGNHLVWVTPAKMALVIDTDDGVDKLSDDEIEKMFVGSDKK